MGYTNDNTDEGIQMWKEMMLNVMSFVRYKKG